MSVSVIGLIGASDEIDRVSKFDNSLSFGAKQKSIVVEQVDKCLQKPCCVVWDVRNESFVHLKQFCLEWETADHPLSRYLVLYYY